MNKKIKYKTIFKMNVIKYWEDNLVLVHIGTE